MKFLTPVITALMLALSLPSWADVQPAMPPPWCRKPRAARAGGGAGEQGGRPVWRVKCSRRRGSHRGADRRRSGAGYSGMRLLLVEDDAVLRLGLKRQLEAEGYRVDMAADGEDGLFQAASTLWIWPLSIWGCPS